MSKQMLAVWGSPGSGKTLTSILLARSLAAKDKIVILVLCDLNAPMLPVVFPDEDPEERSLGVLLSSPEVNQDMVLQNLLLSGDNLGVLGYRKGETINSYPGYVGSKASELLVLLKHQVDYVIVDCNSVLSGQDISSIALQEADAVLRLGSSDLKGPSFMQSWLPVIEMDRRFKSSRHLKALTGIRTKLPWKEISEAYGGVNYHLPYAFEIEQKFQLGKLLEPIRSQEGKDFEKVIHRIIGEVLNE